MSEFLSLVKKHKDLLVWPNVAASILGVTTLRLYSCAKANLIPQYFNDSGRAYFKIGDIIEFRRERIKAAKNKKSSFAGKIKNISEEEVVKILKGAIRSTSMRVMIDNEKV